MQLRMIFLQMMIPVLMVILSSCGGSARNKTDVLDKLAGEWTQDFAQSRPVPDPRLVSRTHRWERLGPDKMRHSSNRIFADGTSTPVENQIDDYSGEPYPDGEEGNTSVFRRIDSKTIQQVRSKDGQIMRFLERKFSENGNILTIRTLGVDAKGGVVQTSGVYNKN
jgi:hypothetical protein